MYNEEKIVCQAPQNVILSTSVLTKIESLESRVMDLKQSLETLEKVLGPLCRPPRPNEIMEGKKEISPEPSHIGGYITSLITEVTKLNLAVCDLIQRIDL